MVRISPILLFMLILFSFILFLSILFLCGDFRISLRSIAFVINQSQLANSYIDVEETAGNCWKMLLA